MQPETYIALAEERAERFHAEADHDRLTRTGPRTASAGSIARLLGWLRPRAAGTLPDLHAADCVHER
jgi:hypothetical protein